MVYAYISGSTLLSVGTSCFSPKTKTSLVVGSMFLSFSSLAILLHRSACRPHDVIRVAQSIVHSFQLDFRLRCIQPFTATRKNAALFMSDTRHVSAKLNSPVFHDGYSSKEHFTDLIFLRILRCCVVFHGWNCETCRKAEHDSLLCYAEIGGLFCRSSCVQKNVARGEYSTTW